MHAIVELCRTYPHILVFLSLAFGYLFGKVKFFGFSLGATTCVLLVSLALGQMDVDIPSILKDISFALFTFCIGYKVGPQFFGALRKEGKNYVIISVLVAFTALGTAIVLGKMLHFDKGTAAGFFAGSVTQSAAVGTAEGAINHLDISDDKKNELDTNVAVAYAITYIFGTAGMLVFIKLVPRFWKIDLKVEAKKLEAQMSGGTGGLGKPELFSWSQKLDLRAYRVTDRSVIGKTVEEFEKKFPARAAVDKIKRGDTVIEPSADMKIQENDILVVVGPTKVFLGAAALGGPEIDASETVNMIGEVMSVCVLNKDVANKTLGEVSKRKEAHGVFLRRITRQGHEIPLTKDTEVHKCDVLEIIGAKEDVERAVKLLGYAERPTQVTDLIMVGIGCVLGTLIGLVAIKIGGIPLTLGMGGGVLVMGLIFGWLRSLHPTFGEISDGGQWLLMNLGLNLFIACIGLSAGNEAVEAFRTTGLTVFLAGCVLALLPVIIGLMVGKHILKMNPVLLLGAVSGARVLTAALNMLQEDADSSMPVIGYAAPYAIGNVLLTIWGSVMVSVM